MSNYVQLGDVHTSYEEDGEALVLLHPGLADSRAFEEYVPEFAHHFHIFQPDRRALTVTDLAGYPGPALIMVGDRDEEIPMEHTLALCEGLPGAQLALLPGASHGSLDARIVIGLLAGRILAGRKEET